MYSTALYHSESCGPPHFFCVSLCNSNLAECFWSTFFFFFVVALLRFGALEEYLPLVEHTCVVWACVRLDDEHLDPADLSQLPLSVVFIFFPTYLRTIESEVVSEWGEKSAPKLLDRWASKWYRSSGNTSLVIRTNVGASRSKGDFQQGLHQIWEEEQSFLADKSKVDKAFLLNVPISESFLPLHALLLLLLLLPSNFRQFPLQRRKL